MTKIEVFLRSTERQRSLSFPGKDETSQALASMGRMLADVEGELAGDTGLHFLISENVTLLRAKSVAEEVGCEYEFVDLTTGKTFDLDKSTLVGVKLIGERELSKSEKKLPAPCLRVGKHVLKFSDGPELSVDEIKKFYLEKQA